MAFTWQGREPTGSKAYTVGFAHNFAHNFAQSLFCSSVLQLSNPWGEPLLFPKSFCFLQCLSKNYNCKCHQVIFLHAAFQGFSTWMSLVSCWEMCSSYARLHIEQKYCHGMRRFSFNLSIHFKGSLDQALTGDFWRKWLTCILPIRAGISLQKSSVSVCLMFPPPVSCKVQTSARTQQSSNTNCPEKQHFNFKEPLGWQCFACPQWETKPFMLMCQSGLQPSGLESRNSWISVGY